MTFDKPKWWGRTWTTNEIIERLETEQRWEDVKIVRTWQKGGWNALKGGNVVFNDGSEESKRLNAENQQARLVHIHNEFGVLALSLYAYPRQLWLDMLAMTASHDDDKNKEQT